MLPRVKIDFANGALSSVTPSADCVVGLVCAAQAVSGKLTLQKPYILYRLDGLAELGVTEAVNDPNALLYKTVKEFYDQAGDGAELWIYAIDKSTTQTKAVEASKEFIKKANGRLRCVAIAVSVTNGTTAGGLDSGVMTAVAAAQTMAEWATESLFAPLFFVMEAMGYTNDKIADLTDLTECNYNRVGLLIGDTTSASTGAAIGVLAGRIAACSVQRHIGRVKDGALNILNAYIGDKDAAVADAETINNKGFITFRTFTGKSGYFFSDDNLATAVSDDYRSIARRRTIDKAYRIVYATMLEHVNDEIPVTDNGELVPAMCRDWESEVISAISNQMTAEGELGTDPSDDSDRGVKCYIDYAQNVLATSKIAMTVQVKPYGYSKYIDVQLGFITTNEED